MLRLLSPVDGDGAILYHSASPRESMAQEYKDLNHVYYERYYQFTKRSEWMEKIWSDAFGEAYPPGLEHYGYLTRQDLADIQERLSIAPGGTLLDIGCGKGGPGLRIAEARQARLIGVDLIPGAVAQAEVFQTQFELAHPAQFLAGDFLALPLADDSVDAVISIDSLWTVTDKVQALREVRRVLRPGGQFIFSNWDLKAVDPVGLLTQSGLSFISRHETANWRHYQRRIYSKIALYQRQLVKEMGDAAQMLLHEAKTSPPYLDASVRRIYEFRRPEL